MEKGRGRGEVRKIHIVYSLCRNGKMDQPHLIQVNHLNCHGVRLRDVKRWLSELRGEDMPECFAWSYKRRYRGWYVWQDLTDDILITAISDNEYVLKGSLLPSLTKTMDRFFDEERSPIKQQAEETELQSKIRSDSLQMDDNILSSEKMNRKDGFFRVGSMWLKETNREGEEQKSSVTTVKKKVGSELIRSNSNERKSTNVMRNFIACMTVETKGSAIRVAQREDNSMSASSQESSSSKSARSSLV